MMDRKRMGRPQRPPKASLRPPDPLQARAADIAKSTGIAPGVARQVASGKLDLNEVLKRMAVADEVNRIMVQHELNRALATQVVLGHAKLEDVLSRRRIEAHLATHRDRSVLEAAAASGKPLTLGLHGHKTCHGTVLAVDRYEFTFKEAESGTESVIHKLQAKYAFAPDEYKKVKKALDYDKVRRERTVEPRPRPQDRFGCSDRRLGQAMDRKTPVTAVTLEGECFTGEVAWIGRYEFGLRSRAGGEVVIFRHALDDLRDNTQKGGR
jgi:hypothetical protein